MVRSSDTHQTRAAADRARDSRSPVVFNASQKRPMHRKRNQGYKAADHRIPVENARGGTDHEVRPERQEEISAGIEGYTANYIC